MEGKTFRLGEYLITDFGSGLIGWEAHHDFGLQRSGRCHRWGKVLVLGEFEEEKSGYLKGEFLDRLKTLPPWDHTRYFCLSSQLRMVNAGRGFDNTLLKEIGDQGIQRKVQSGRTGADEAGPFRLGRYRITAVPDREFIWETWGDGNTIVKGNCSPESGILLMGPAQGLSGEQNKREFIQQLRRLPLWQDTRLWCRQDALQPCRIPVGTKIPRPLPPPQIPKPRFIKSGGAANFETGKKAEKLKRDQFKNWKSLWPDLWRNWKPERPRFSRIRSFWASGVKFPSLPWVFSRLPRPKQPGGLSPPLKARGKRRRIAAIFILVAILMALLLTTLYLVLKSGLDHSHYWKHHYKPKDH